MSESKNILITGGSGLVGRALTRLLQASGYTVSWYTRSAKQVEGVQCYFWDVALGKLDKEAIIAADYIIHLAGEGIADKRWTKEQKKEIMDSRVQSTQLIHQVLSENDHKVQAFISASGIGYYGYDNGGVLLHENSRFGDDFVAKVVKEWEGATDTIAALGIRTVKLRTGLVLSDRGGALAKMLTPFKLGLGSPLGSGHQYMSWVHIDDLCGIYLHALQQNLEGVFNATAPYAVTNKAFGKVLASCIHKPYFMPSVPSWVLRIALGEMAALVLGSGNVSSEKIIKTGYQFQYERLDEALSKLLA